MNIEFQRKDFIIFVRQTERSDSILRNSAVRDSTFSSSIPNPVTAVEAADLIWDEKSATKSLMKGFGYRDL
jgi:hypothetical protein